MASMAAAWQNPFTAFLETAKEHRSRIPSEPDVSTDPSLVPYFVELTEQRNFVFDVVDRVETLATAFDRLHNLSEANKRAYKLMHDLMEQQRMAAPERTAFDVPDELMIERNQSEAEARMLVSFIYYEFSSLVTLLRKFFTPAAGSHLEYLCGVRNKILAHPNRAGRTKRSSLAVALGPILHTHLLGASSWMPLVKNWYLEKLRAYGTPPDDDAGRKQNEALLRDRKKRTKDLSEPEILSLKTFTIPEPDPLQSAWEMAELLQSHFAPEIAAVCAARASDRVKTGP